MTLGDFFTVCSKNPAILIFYLTAVPLTALLALVFGRGQGRQTPWKYLYSFLVYLTCLPGMFAIVLTLYLILFEQRSILDINLYTQVLPVISMVITLFLIRKNVALEHVPGFGRLSGLLLTLFAFVTLMWVLERTRIFAITIIPFVWAIIIFIAIVGIAALGIRRMGARH